MQDLIQRNHPQRAGAGRSQRKRGLRLRVGGKNFNHDSHRSWAGGHEVQSFPKNEEKKVVLAAG